MIGKDISGCPGKESASDEMPHLSEERNIQMLQCKGRLHIPLYLLRWSIKDSVRLKLINRII